MTIFHWLQGYTKTRIKNPHLFRIKGQVKLFQWLTSVGKNVKLCLNNTSYVVKMRIDTTIFAVNALKIVWLGCFFCAYPGITQAACDRAAQQAKNITEQQVKQRAQLRWDALVKGDLKTAYDYLSPSVRSLQSYDEYLRKIHRRVWTAATVSEVRCEETVCTVQVTITFNASRFPNMSSNLEESWIKVDNEWWLGQHN